MAYYSGNTGKCKIDDSVIGGVQSWSVNITKEVPETTPLSSDFKTFQATTYSSEGTVELLVLDGSGGQGVFFNNVKAIGTLTDLVLEFDTSESIQISKAIVTSVDFGLGSSAIGTATCNFIGTGAVTFNGLV